MDSNGSVQEEGKHVQPNLRQKGNEDHLWEEVFSIAQDVEYSVIGDRMWTPDHIGLGCSLPQEM